MIIDTHCHYNLDPLHLGDREHPTANGDKDVNGWRDHWAKAQAQGVNQSIVVGVNFFTSGTAIEIANQDENLFAAIGCHPTHYDQVFHRMKETQKDPSELMSVVKKDQEELSLLFPQKKIVAIGETGLDYFHLSQDQSVTAEEKQLIKEVQKESFRQHLELAKDQNLPVIIHVRDKEETAYWDVLDILGTIQLTKPFILHCISGPVAYVQKAVEIGGYVGVAANVTYKTADHIRELVKSVPSGRLVLETDAPFLPPQEFRGQICEPWMISLTAKYLESELHISPTTCAETAQGIFNLPTHI